VSEVPQGSGPLLFLIYVKSKIKLFADYTKVWRVINSDADSRELQNDINVLQQ